MVRGLVVGILTAPDHLERRAWLRQHTLWPPAFTARFVLGYDTCKPPCAASDLLARARLEAKEHGDVVVLSDSLEGRGTGGPAGAFPSKSLAWWRYAVRAFPTTAFLAKADDDSWVHPAAVDGLLSRLTQLGTPRIWSGWLQYASFVSSSTAPIVCGWSPVARDAAVGALHPGAQCQQHLRGLMEDPSRHSPRNCGVGETIDAPSIVGPYPFAAGPFELMSGPLAQEVFNASRTEQFAALLDRYLECALRTAPRTMATSLLSRAEDALIGYVVHAAAREVADVAFVALNGPGWMGRRPLISNMNYPLPLMARDSQHAWERGVEAAELLAVADARHRVERMLVLHKFEPSEQAIREQDRKEAWLDATMLRRNITPIGHMRINNALSRKLRPLLEHLASRPRRASAALNRSDWLELQCHKSRSPVRAAPSVAHVIRSRQVLAPAQASQTSPSSVLQPLGLSQARVETLKQVRGLGSETDGIAVLLPQWRFCTAQYAMPEAATPASSSSTAGRSTRDASQLAEEMAGAAAPEGLVWRALGGLAASTHEQPARWGGGYGFSLAACLDGCAAGPDCRSIAYSAQDGHCIPLRTVINARTPTKCLPCGCACYHTYYLAPTSAADPDTRTL